MRFLFYSRRVRKRFINRSIMYKKKIKGLKSFFVRTTCIWGIFKSYETYRILKKKKPIKSSLDFVSIEWTLPYSKPSLLAVREIHAFIPRSAATSTHHETRTPSRSSRRGGGRRASELGTRYPRRRGSPPLLLLVQRIVSRAFPQAAEEPSLLLFGRLAEITCNTTTPAYISRDCLRNVQKMYEILKFRPHRDESQTDYVSDDCKSARTHHSSHVRRFTLNQ